MRTVIKTSSYSHDSEVDGYRYGKNPGCSSYPFLAGEKAEYGKWQYVDSRSEEESGEHHGASQRTADLERPCECDKECRAD